MDLHHYLTRLYSLVTSRQEIDVEQLFADETIPGREGIIEGRLRFRDGSLLEFVETWLYAVSSLSKQTTPITTRIVLLN